MAAPAGFAGLVLYEPPVAVSEPLGGESLQGRAAAALQDGDRDRALTIFFRDIVQVPRPFTAATRLVRPTWRKLRECIPAQVADTEAIDSLGVGVDRYVCRRSSARV